MILLIRNVELTMASFRCWWLFRLTRMRLLIGFCRFKLTQEMKRRETMVCLPWWELCYQFLWPWNGNPYFLDEIRMNQLWILFSFPYMMRLLSGVHFSLGPLFGELYFRNWKVRKEKHWWLNVGLVQDNFMASMVQELLNFLRMIMGYEKHIMH